MKVVFIHTDFRLYWVARLEHLYESFKKDGDDFEVIEISGKGSPYSFSNNVNIGVDWWHILYPEERMEDISFKQASKKLFDKLDELNPDFVFSGSIAFTSGATSVNWCRTRRKHIVMFDNSRLMDVPRSRLVNFIKKRLYSNVDAVLIPSQEFVKDYEFWGFTSENMFFGLNVIDNNKWRDLIPNSLELSSIRKENKLPSRFIMTVGRQVKKKNFLKLVQSFHEENQSSSLLYSLILIGNGPQRSIIERYIHDNSVKNIILTDFKSQEELASFYALCDAVILPSLEGETWGLVVNEAMACRKPVLVSNKCGCCSTLVQDGKTGFSFDPENTSEIRKVLREVGKLSQKELNKMGDNAQNLIADWGLDRFEKGVREAIENISKTSVRTFSGFLDKCLIKLWKGRYRPT